MKFFKLFLLFISLNLTSTKGESSHSTEPPRKSVFQHKAKILKIHNIEADVKIIAYDKDIVTIYTFGKGPDAYKITHTPSQHTLNIYQRIKHKNFLTNIMSNLKKNPEDTPDRKIYIFVPHQTLFDINMQGNSHLLTSHDINRLKLTLKDNSQASLGTVNNLVYKGYDHSKIDISSVTGLASLSLNDNSHIRIQKGKLDKCICDASKNAFVSITAFIKDLQVITKGNPTLEFLAVKDNLKWRGQGNEKALFGSIKGHAHLSVNFSGMLRAQNVHLDNLIATTSAQGSIELNGEVHDASLTATGASSIHIKKITGQVLSKNVMGGGNIKIEEK